MLKIEVISVYVERSYVDDDLTQHYCNKFRLRLVDFSDNEVTLEGYEIEDDEIDEECKFMSRWDPFMAMVNSLLRLYMRSRFGVN